MSEPLIWTTKGNLPIKDLEYETKWEDHQDFMKFSEIYRLNGEIVKEGAHVYMKRGLQLEAIAEKL